MCAMESGRTSDVSHGERRSSAVTPGGGGRNRTAVRGFAGPCLNHSATPPEGASLSLKNGSPAASESDEDLIVDVEMVSGVET